MVSKNRIEIKLGLYHVELCVAFETECVAVKGSKLSSWPPLKAQLKTRIAM